MIYLACFILLFSVAQFIVAIANLLWGRFNHQTSSKLNQVVSILIPARNEEENISFVLKDLQEQDHPDMEIMVFDDMSDDRTAEIVSGFSQSDSRIRLIRSDGLPSGWTGKNFACDSLAREAKGMYLLFLDADVRAGKDIVSRALSYAEKHKLKLFTIFPEQEMVTPGEWSTVPLMHYILLSLLPLALVRKSGFPSLSAANGQFMLFEAKTYNDFKPHERFRHDLVEDIKIARFLKRKRVKIACLSGDSSIRCRMYQDFKTALNGFSKNLVSFFGGSFLMAVLFWIMTTFGFIFIFIFLSAFMFIFYISLVISTRIIVSYTAGQDISKNLLYLIPQQLTIGAVISRAFMNRIHNKYEWKGRNIS